MYYTLSLCYIHIVLSAPSPDGPWYECYSGNVHDARCSVTRVRDQHGTVQLQVTTTIVDRGLNQSTHFDIKVKNYSKWLLYGKASCIYSMPSDLVVGSLAS